MTKLFEINNEVIDQHGCVSYKTNYNIDKDINAFLISVNGTLTSITPIHGGMNGDIYVLVAYTLNDDN